MVLDANEIFIGCCGIHHINAESVELGLWLKENSQSQGFGTEIISSLINLLNKISRLIISFILLTKKILKVEKILKNWDLKNLKLTQSKKMILST